MEIRKVDAGQGWRWIADGYGLFKKNPPIWIVLFVIYFLIIMLFTIIPLVGPLIMSVLAPVFAAGFVLACRDLENGSELELRYLIAGFMHNTGQLVTVGVLYLIGSIIIMGLMMLGGGGSILGAIAVNGMNGGESPDVAIGAVGGMLVALLIALMLLIPLLMAYWFAPALVFFNGMSAQDAMKASFSACVKNWLPFTVYGAIGFGLTLLAMIPFGLGMFVLIPVITASIYTGYKDIFVPAATATE
jgi:uncharacterized membrane protein